MQRTAFTFSGITAPRAPQVDWCALSVSALVQCGLLSLFVSSITIAAPGRTVGNGGISVFDVGQVNAKPAPVAPRKVAVEVPPPVVRVKIDTIAAAAKPVPQLVATAASAGEVCDVAAIVGQAVQGNPDTLATLTAVDAGDSPVSRAVMLWDGAWVGNSALAPVHQSVVGAIAAASPACLAEPISGPSFMFLDNPVGGKTIVLVIGTGTWRWQDVIDSDRSLLPPLDTLWPSLLTSDRSLFPSTGQDVDAPS